MNSTTRWTDRYLYVEVGGTRIRIDLARECRPRERETPGRKAKDDGGGLTQRFIWSCGRRVGEMSDD